MKKILSGLLGCFCFIALSLSSSAEAISRTVVINPDNILILYKGNNNGKVCGFFGLKKNLCVKVDDVDGFNFDGSTTDVGTSVVNPIEGGYRTAVITGTPSSEETGAALSVRLKNGEILAFNPTKWHFVGLKVKGTALFTYGEGDDNPPPPPSQSRMDFVGGKLVVGFNVNPRKGGIVKGFMQDVNIFDIQDMRWSSDKFGWGDLSTAIGTFPMDTTGNIVMPVITISGLFLFPDDNGNVVIRKKDGSLVWANLGYEGWKFSPNVTIDQKEGRIIYTGNQ